MNPQFKSWRLHVWNDFWQTQGLWAHHHLKGLFLETTETGSDILISFFAGQESQVTLLHNLLEAWKELWTKCGPNVTIYKKRDTMDNKTDSRSIKGQSRMIFFFILKIQLHFVCVYSTCNLLSFLQNEVSTLHESNWDQKDQEEGKVVFSKD